MTGKLWLGTLITWLAIWIATPIMIWVFGPQTFPGMATLGVAAQAAVTLVSLLDRWRPVRILGTLGTVFLGTWLVEKLGVTMGFPFGSYTYSDLLQPQIAEIPLLIPFAWWMMLVPAWAVASSILGERAVGSGQRQWLSLAALAGLCFTAWDLYLDPQMAARQLWMWEQPGGYFGIPWQNYLGWWLAAVLLTWVVRPQQLPRQRLLVIYSLTWLFQAIGLAFFWGLPGPALAGFAGMGIFVFWAWYKEVAQWKSSCGRFSLSCVVQSLLR
jgi:uncharacterized membrane protein